MLRNLSLVLVLALAAWALWPGASASSDGSQPSAPTEAPRKYTLRFAPGIYMPGRRPMDVGKPIEGLKGVAEAFEKLYPDTRIEFTEAPVGQREYLVTQLAAEQAPEILNVNVEDVWQDVQKGWYIPLDPYLERPNPFIPKGEPGSVQWWDQFKYEAISRGKAAPDGKMYCLTIDMIETGVFYNKDIFRSLGLSVPKTWEELVRVEETVKRAGLIPFLVGSTSVADWGMDLVFDQLYGEILPGIDLAKDRRREAYLQGYLDWDELAFLNTQGFFTRRDPRFVEIFRLLKDWRRYFQKNMASEIFRLFVTQRGAMMWDASPLVYRLEGDPDRKFDWGVFYLPPMTRQVSRFADGHPMVVVGGSGTQLELTNSVINDTGDPATSVKLQRAIAFLQFLTVPENTDRVVNEVLALLPNIKGVEPRPELMPFHEILQRRYTTTKWLYAFDLRFNEIFRRMLDLYLDDGISLDEFMGWMESNVRTASETVVRRKGLDLSKFEPEWRRLAPLRANMRELPR